MKRNSKPKKFSDILQDFFKTRHKKKQIITNPLKLWLSVVGIHVKNETKEVFVKNNVLYVSIYNPYLKSDLIAKKTIILQKIKEINNNIIDLIFN